MRQTILDPRLIRHLRRFAISRCNVYRRPLAPNELGELVPGTRELFLSEIACYKAHDDSDKGELQEVRSTDQQYTRVVYRVFLEGFYPEIKESVVSAGVTYRMEVEVDGVFMNLIGVNHLPIEQFTQLVVEEVKNNGV